MPHGQSQSRCGHARADLAAGFGAGWGLKPDSTAKALEAQAVALADGVSAEAAACFGIPAMTALHAVRCNGGVQGQDVLVTGGAGAVGHYAIQMAKLLGARRVISTVSSDAKAQDFRASVGVGISWISPVGPLKLSYGKAIRYFEQDKIQRLQFQIGTVF